jgi:hypothetical protein
LQPGEVATIAMSLMDSAVLAERATLGLSDADLPDPHSVKVVALRGMGRAEATTAWITGDRSKTTTDC